MKHIKVYMLSRWQRFSPDLVQVQLRYYLQKKANKNRSFSFQNPPKNQHITTCRLQLYRSPEPHEITGGLAILRGLLDLQTWRGKKNTPAVFHGMNSKGSSTGMLVRASVNHRGFLGRCILEDDSCMMVMNWWWIASCCWLIDDDDDDDDDDETTCQHFIHQPLSLSLVQHFGCPVGSVVASRKAPQLFNGFPLKSPTLCPNFTDQLSLQTYTSN